jgi:alpha-beta hydrolase superfamily lysophospholipase
MHRSFFLQGNAKNISTHIGSVYWLPEQGVNVFLLDYRDFGRSLGDPAIPAIFQDVESFLPWLRERFPQCKIFIFGQSIGSAIATTSMALFKDEYQLSGLILDASLTDYRDITQEVTGCWLLGPFTWLLPTQRGHRCILRIYLQVQFLCSIAKLTQYCPLS